MENHVPIKSITVGQIGKFYDILVAALQKSGLPSEPTQQVLEQQGAALADEFVLSVRNRVEAISSFIVRRVRVDRTRTPMEVINATGRNKYLNDDVVATMPQGEGDEVDVYFVPTKRFVPADEVSAFLAQYGLVPDPRAQAAVNEADPAFADKYPNGTQWGDNCYLTFDRWYVERNVNCYRNDHDWDGSWFLSGVLAPRK
mgnify:FL=1